MATFNQKDIQLLFVGAAATKTTGGIDTLNTGEIGLFTPGGTRLTEASAATATEFVIVQDRGTNPLLTSGTITKGNIQTAVRKTTVAATEKLDYIGYNGSAGSIENISDTKYHVRLNLREGLTSNHGGLYLKHAFYESDTTATQSEIAAGLHQSLIDNFSKETDEILRAERLTSSVTAPVTLVETYSPIHGSKYVQASGAVTAVVGQAIRFGAATVGTPAYIVAAVSGTILTLDVKYQGDSATAISGNKVTDDGDWGIKLEGRAKTFTVGKIHYDKMSWEMTLENFGTTTVTNTTAATFGSGTSEQIQELEWFCQGNEGDFYHVGEPNLFSTRADASGTYSLIDLVYQENYTGSIVSGPIHKRYTLAIPSTTPNYALTATADDITDVLEVLSFGSANADLDLG